MKLPVRLHREHGLTLILDRDGTQVADVTTMYAEAAALMVERMNTAPTPPMTDKDIRCALVAAGASHVCLPANSAFFACIRQGVEIAEYHHGIRKAKK